MSKTVIKVEGLGKKYVIGHERQGQYVALRDVIAERFNRLTVKLFSWGKNNSTNKQFNDSTKEEFWALKDINLEIKEGDRVGIIGRNGAGKSTLLKILSRITDPTKGRVSIRGRVASLLEVGTGFHPELTGRENIYLNGAILGMRRAEIKRKFDEIVDFAEVEKFLDTPVKRYSSGMYVRLAFAVAAHLEPEILIVDEVLAVGDIKFQKKCLGKMEDVSNKGGRTVLFVSHNMDAIKRLCGRTILLSAGNVIGDGESITMTDKYLAGTIDGSDKRNIYQLIKNIPNNSIFKLNKINLTQEGSSSLRFVSSKDIIIDFDYEIFEPKKRFFISFQLNDTAGNTIFETFHNGGKEDIIEKTGKHKSRAVIPAGSLVPIIYELKLWFGIFGDRNFNKETIAFIFEVVSDSVNYLVYSARSFEGKIMSPVKWQNL